LAWRLGELGDPLYGLAAGVVDPRHVCLVGVRSYEQEEDERLRRLGVRVVFMDEIRRRGIEAVLAEALDIATAGTSAFGVSIDLDVVTPEDAPDVGTPVAGGVTSEELARALGAIAARPSLAAIELVEYSPRLDRDGRTARVALDLLAAALCGSREDAQVLADALERKHP
jgi:arginase family enzyme